MLRGALKDDADVVSLVLQKEYLFVSQNSPKPLIGTVSVRGCYAITLYHSKKSGIIHWDDNTKYSELQRVIDKFLDGKLLPQDCQVNVVGGWKDDKESLASGEFLIGFFLAKGFQLSRDNFQTKKSKGQLSAQGFSLVVLDSRDGKIKLSDKWPNDDVVKHDFGPEPEERERSRKYMDKTHGQTEGYPDSGTKLISIDAFPVMKKQQIHALCAAARDGKKDEVIRLLDNGIIDITMCSDEISRWTALHFACKMGHFECAKILVQNGADIHQKNSKGHTALDLIKNDKETRGRLEVLWELVQFNIQRSGEHGLRALAMHARHPEYLETQMRDQVALVLDMDTAQIRSMLMRPVQ